MLLAWAALFGAVFVVAGCYSAGDLLIAWSRAKLSPSERAPLAFVTGAAVVHLAMFAALALKIAHRGVIAAILGGFLIRAIVERRRGVSAALPKLDRALWIPFCIVFGAFTIYYLPNAWAPETSPDGAAYHLGLVARYLRAHGFERVTTDMYATLSQGVEVLYLAAFAFGKHSAAALLHLAFTIALALGMFAWGRRIGKPWVGAAGALLTYVSPVVGRDGTTAYIDVATAAITFAVFYWLEIWDEQRDSRILVLIGLVAGYAYAAKYTAFVMAPYAMVFVAWRSRKLRPALIVTAAAAVMVAPWMLKNWLYVHNPVAPLANAIFRNPYFHVSAERQWEAYLRNYDLPNRWKLFTEDTLDGGKTQGLLGPVFVLAPLALLALRFREGRRLLIPGLLLFATYFGNVGTRFLIPCLPFFSLAMALALSWPPALGALVAIHAVLSWPATLPHYANKYLWRLETMPWKGALRIQPQEEYLKTNLWSYDLIQLVDEKVPPGERVFAYMGVPQAYTRHELVMSYQAAENNILGDSTNIGWGEAFQPSRLYVFRFPPRTARRIRLLQTGSATRNEQQWNVHELRYFSKSAEIARRPEWRLRAWPNPWEVQLAFDNSPATRWRSWEQGARGMWIETDFGRDETVDEVQMLTSPEWPWPIRLNVEVADAQGLWQKVTDQFEDRDAQVHGWIRRAATYELLKHGIRYMLVHDSDWGADDFRDDPEAWGLEVIGRGREGTLYKVKPL
jgi:Dolichyl-phosphate-mannose-protein mannosyltransferase